ncbi:MAG TPA: hypothetical protein PK867_25225 [Pirellulales bacterium]|nr:hypothetical protein [Pirellulales bacterium]
MKEILRPSRICFSCGGVFLPPPIERGNRGSAASAWRRRQVRVKHP